MSRRFTIDAVFRAVDRITAPINRMQNRMQRFTRSMTQGITKLNRRVQRLSKSMHRMAFISGAALVGLATSMSRVLKIGIDFEQTLVNAAAKFSTEIVRGTEAFQDLEDAARKVGRETEFTASNAAEALNFLAMAGADAKDAIVALPSVVDLATAASVGLGRATDIVTDTLGAFNIESSNSAELLENLRRVSGVMAKAANTANTDIDGLFESFKKAAPFATSLGLEIEDLAAILGTLANAGEKDAIAGTKLNRLLIRLAAPTPAAAKAIKNLGVSLEEAGTGKARNVIDILADLQEVLPEVGLQKRGELLAQIFGSVPLSAVNILLSKGSVALREYRAGLTGVSDETEILAGIMRDTVSGQLRTLNSLIEDIKISIFSLNRGELSDVIDLTIDWVRANGDLIASKIAGYLSMLFRNFREIATWLKRIVIGMAAFMAFSTALRTFVLIMTAFNLAVAAAGLPFVLIALAVVALVAAIIILVKWWDVFVAKFKDLSPIAQFFLSTIAAPIVAIALLAKALIAAWGPVKSFFSNLWSSIASIFEGHIGRIMSFVTPLTNALGLIGGVGRFFPAGAQGGATPSIVSPEERVANNLVEKRTTNSSEVTIKDETGRAELTSGLLGPALTLMRTGAF